MRFLIALTVLFASTAATAKPIAFADSFTLMLEYGGGHMEEAQLYYAPRHFYSAGLGYLSQQGDGVEGTRSITYARINYLARRWNLERAQGNAFLWGGLGRAHLEGRPDELFAWNAGGQIDYETRRIYTALKTDLHSTSAFTDRTDTLQLGWAPYEHDYDKLATWLVVQVRNYDGRLARDTEYALLLRLFTSRVWIEAGANTDGKLQALLRLTF